MGAERFASIDPEEFYDFTEARPLTRIVDGESRAIDWPSVDFLHAPIPGAGRDVVFVRGVEPHLKWKTFCRAVLSVATSIGVETTLILAALLADVPHTRPVRVSGSSDDGALAGRFDLSRSDYEGPTGIVGVLQHACQQAGLPAASMWAAVPHYVHQVPSPKAALALIERSAQVLGTEVDPVELRDAADEYERQVSERVSEDDDAAIYVAQLEEADDEQPELFNQIVGESDVNDLASEVERFLRQHRPGS